jgi:glycosyltransferase involved in cell wall biosynthesis
MNLILLNATCVGEKPDGIAVYCREVIKRILAEKQKKHYIIYINRKGINEMSFLTQRENVTLHIIPGWFSDDHGFIGHLLRLFFSQYLALRFPRTIIFNPSPLEMALRHKFQAVMIHDLIPLFFPDDHRKQVHFYKYFLASALRCAGAVITPSKHTMKMIKKRFHPDPGKLFIIHNGIKLPVTKHINGTKRKENFILYLGRLSPTKNVVGLINAYRKIADQVPQKLVIAGAGDINLLKEQDPGGPGTVEFMGYISDEEVDRLLSTAALFVFPSFYEGFGFPPLEAMARGCPVIVSNTASLPEVCGKAAIYADPYDINSISKAILRVLQDKDLQSRLIKAGYKRVRKFTWVRTARQHQQVFDFIAKGMK